MASLLRPALAAQLFTTGKLLPRDRALAPARPDRVLSKSLTCTVNLVYHQSIPQTGIFQALPRRRWLVVSCPTLKTVGFGYQFGQFQG